MYQHKSGLALQKRLSRHGTTVMLGAIFLFFSVLLYLSICMSSCNEGVHPNAHAHHEKSSDDDDDDKLLWKPADHQFQHTCFIAVLVLTAPKAFEKRDVIRQTWLSTHSKDKICVFFSLGTQSLSVEEKQTLEYENSNNKDLLLLKNLTDSYNKLTEKVLKSFIWIDHNVKYTYLLKVDDDSYARMDVIAQELQKKPTRRLYWGFFDGRARVKKKGKWEEKQWFLSEHYLPHALGGGYVLSGDLVHYLAQSEPYLQRYNSEDVSVGVWLAGLDLHRIHDPRFDTEFKSRGCHNSYIVTHKQSPADMKRLHRNLKENGKLCSSEFRTRNSYEYNWNVNPALCCIRNDTSVP